MSDYWDYRAKINGHTGYSSSVAYAYDQLVRLKIVDDLIREWGGGNDRKTCCLDFGCGTGEFSMHEEQRFDKFVLYDICKPVLEKIKLNKESVVFSDLDMLIESSELFDCILCITVLEHILDDNELHKVLEFMRNRLKDEGIFILLMLISDRQDVQCRKSWDLDDLIFTMRNTGFNILSSWDLYEDGLVNDEGFKKFRKKPLIRLLGKIYSYMPDGGKRSIRKYMSVVADNQLKYKKGKDYLWPLSEKQGHKVMVLKNETDSDIKKI